MKDRIRKEDLMPLIHYVGTSMNGKRDILAELDSQTGDGDMGVTIALIFRSAERYIKRADPEDGFSEIFEGLAETIEDNAPSTFGTFFATMLENISKNSSHFEEIGAEEFASVLSLAAEGVMARGGAKKGDKTLLDALIPAAEAAAAETELSKAAKAAARAAAAGAEETVNLKATTGRAGYMGMRTVGYKDPGAQAIADILTAVEEFISG